VNKEEAGVSKHNDLATMVYHTDARVTAMEGQLTGLGQSMSRIEAHMMDKPPFNAAPWIGIGLTILFAGIGGMFTGMKYIQLTQEPLRVDIQELWSADRLEREREQKVMEFIKQTHYEFGRITEWKDGHIDASNNHDSRFHSLEEKVGALQEQSAITQVALEAIGAYAKEQGARTDEHLRASPNH
jgi:hypothetical protein